MKASQILQVFLTVCIVFSLVLVLFVLFTGGYSFHLYGTWFETWELSSLTIVLCLLTIAYRVACHRKFPSWGMIVSAPCTILLPLLLTVYMASGGKLGSRDSVPTAFLPLSILREGDFDLDEYQFLKNLYYVKFVNGHHVSAYPVGAAILATPIYFLSAIGSANPAVFSLKLEKFSAAWIVALSAVLFFFLVKRLTTRKMALLLTFVYALGSSSLSASSQALWQHGPSQLALTAGLYCLVRGSRWTGYAGFPFAFAVLCRPTDIVFASLIALYVLLNHRAQAMRFLIASIPPALFLLTYNFIYFANPLHTQFPIWESWKTPFWQGFTGILFSPGRGLFFYSPVFLFSIMSLAMAWRRTGDPLLHYLTLGTLLTVVVYSKWKAWWGGGCYGPRMLADLSPILTLFLYLLREQFIRSRLLRIGFALAIVFSIVAHGIGPFWDRLDWNRYVYSQFINKDHIESGMWWWTDNPVANFAKQMFSRFIISARNLPTSRTDPEKLYALFSTEVMKKSVPNLVLSVVATNAGQAVWLEGTKYVPGSVRLKGCWYSSRSNEPLSCSLSPVHVDVFPYQSHRFLVRSAPPRKPGTYFLEFSMESLKVSPFRGSRLWMRVRVGKHGVKSVKPKIDRSELPVKLSPEKAARLTS